ncbi:hypothetical protein [Methanobrevibacter sp.]|uniref:hypothetical protein n=1 Tax=Methanobrevibacter sp. TaxID=66852 RepID=UPI00388D6D81
MSKLELRPFEEQLANVIYANRLDQAEKKGEEKGFEKGEKEGFEKGERNVILKLLEKDTPEEISEKYNIPLEKMEKIEKSKNQI